jgi:hypothetical protein
VKNWPWIVGALGAMTFFAVFEYLGFTYPYDYNTLSAAVASLGAAWPYGIFLMGFFCGGLSVHFFWSWKTNPIGAGGG